MRSIRTTGRSSTRFTTQACSRASGRPSPCWTAGTGGFSTGRSTKRTWTASSQTSRPLPTSRCTSPSPTKPGAIPRRPPELFRPGPRPDEWDEGTWRPFLDLEASVRLPGRDHQDLPAARTDGGDDPPARRELKPPRIRDVGSARGRHDAVVGGALGVAETAVPDHDGHGRYANPGQVR